ncbi:putative OPA3-like protein [Halotydeus destructor]|nr:putative OPA3-like protein [Halotydeus destructor]
MVVPGAFPLVKLGALAVKQIAKPLANYMKTSAKSSPVFRDYVVMPPAQLYHWLEVNVKMRMLNLGKPRGVQKLDQNAAIELGADLLGEFIIFIVAATTVTFEYLRQSRNSEAAAIELNEKWQRIDERLSELEYITTQQSSNIQDLSRLVYAMSGTIKLPKEKPNSDSASGEAKVIIDQGAISLAIRDIASKLTGK